MLTCRDCTFSVSSDMHMLCVNGAYRKLVYWLLKCCLHQFLLINWYQKSAVVFSCSIWVIVIVYLHRMERCVDCSNTIESAGELSSTECTNNRRRA